MIIFEGRRNIFECESQTLACTTNVAGAMGAGIALQFKERIPGVYAYYRKLFPLRFNLTDEDGAELVKQLHVYRSDPAVDRQVLLFPTKIHWRNPSKVEWIERNLETLCTRYEALGITSLAVPPLGCANGGLSYSRDVRPIMHRFLGELPIPVEIVWA